MRYTESRVRFNWGYQDGAGDILAKRSPRSVAGHFDAVYAQGYEYGIEDARNDAFTGDSTLAWKSRASLKRAPRTPSRRR